MLNERYAPYVHPPHSFETTAKLAASSAFALSRTTLARATRLGDALPEHSLKSMPS
jgi:hypothetical protein